MKLKTLYISAIIFFLFVNSTYYWEASLGLFAFPAFLFLFICFIILCGLLVKHLTTLVTERFKNKQRLWLTITLAAILAATYLRPTGIINFEQFESTDLLIAEREGAANCMTTLKLKADFTFRERNVCFAISEISGTYRIKNDTIYFENISPGRLEKNFYAFAVIKQNKYTDKSFNIVRFSNLQDTKGHELWIRKNELARLKENHRL